MKTRTWSKSVLGISLSLAGVGAPCAFGQEPNRLPMTAPAASESMAQSVLRRLRESGQLVGYRINVVAQNGVVDLAGEVADERQRQCAIELARSMPGVVGVRDWLQVRASSEVVQAQAPLLQPLPIPQPGVGAGPPAAPERIDGQLPEPTPIFQAPMGPNPTMQPPPMPPYAWPTFAPYNNYSRVAYPNANAYEQWPFIGPMYPFPKVPLGWRSVTLTWEDGHWWFRRSPSGHDWWRIRYH